MVTAAVAFPTVSSVSRHQHQQAILSTSSLQPLHSLPPVLAALLSQLFFSHRLPRLRPVTTVLEVVVAVVLYLSSTVHEEYPAAIPRADIPANALFCDASGQVLAAPPPRSTNSRSPAMVVVAEVVGEGGSARRGHETEAQIADRSPLRRDWSSAPQS